MVFNLLHTKLRAISVASAITDGLAQRLGFVDVTCWIDTATSLLVRADAVTETKEEDGISTQEELMQAFAYTCPSVSEPEEYSELETNE